MHTFWALCSCIDWLVQYVSSNFNSCQKIIDYKISRYVLFIIGKLMGTDASKEKKAQIKYMPRDKNNYEENKTGIKP